jgi:aldehyde:ferredoxin oxidoreductase
MATLGYAGKILRVDLSSGSAAELSTPDYANKFLGGRGIAAKIYWDEVPPQASAFDEENGLIFATGPLAGIPVLGGSRWHVCGKSPAPSPERFCHCNLGGRWGVELKFAGYDAILIRGKSEKPVYLLLHDDVSELRDASGIWGKGAIETREILKGDLGSSVSLVAIGPAGENMVSMATLLADNDASGSGGLGAVMGSKKLKAIVVKSTTRRARVARPERLRELTGYFRGLDTGPISKVSGMVLKVTGPRTRKEPCYGCLGNCLRRTYQAEDGKRGKFMCQAAVFYQLFQPLAERPNGAGKEVPFHATKLCDDYGLDTMALTLTIAWLYGCYAAGILTDENTGIPISKLGNLEFIETLVEKISRREGFGNILAQGVPKAADWVGPRAKELTAGYVSKAGQPAITEPRLYITTALLYAMEQKPPMPQLQEISRVVFKWLDWCRGAKNSYVSTDVARRIARRFWGSEVAADFSTHDGKALAARMIQNRQYAKDCLILCSFLWPILDLEHSEDHVGDPTLESKVLSAVTGNEVDEDGLNGIGERVFNLQRAILVREGHQGREDDKIPDSWHTMPLEGDPANPECLVPGKGDEALSRRGSVVDKEQFERTKDEYYQLRQWDLTTGLQTRAKLEGLGLTDVARDLERRGLIS